MVGHAGGLCICRGLKMITKIHNIRVAALSNYFEIAEKMSYDSYISSTYQQESSGVTQTWPLFKGRV